MLSQSVVIKAPQQLRIEACKVPTIGINEVLIKVLLAGICGSDVHILHGANPFARYPRIIGHEFFGVITAVGQGVAASRLGERVVVDPVISCGHCYACLIGKPNVCRELQVIGVHRDGGFGEYCVVPSRNAYQVPNDISDQAAVLIEPFTIAANICEQLQPKPQDIALIYGAGPMGLTILQAMKKVYGVREVIVVERIAERLERAKENGADTVMDNQQQSLVTLLSQQHIQPTLIIDAACHPAILNEALTIAAPAARLGILGFSNQPCVINQQLITSKELTIFSSRLNSRRFPLVINWMQQGKIQPEFLVTHHFEYQQVLQAMELFEKDQKKCCKVLLHFSKE